MSDALKKVFSRKITLLSKCSFKGNEPVFLTQLNYLRDCILFMLRRIFHMSFLKIFINVKNMLRVKERLEMLL